MLAGATLVTMFTIVIANTLWETVLQSEVPGDVLSRVSSYDWAISIVFMPIGFALWGPLSDWIGFDETLYLAAGVFLVSRALTLLLPEIRSMERTTPG